jgi:ArpU family phage transcriptional regulator
MKEERLFDLAEYSIPSPQELNMRETKKEIMRFITIYRNARTANDFRRDPVITSVLSLAEPNFSTSFHSTTEEVAIWNIENDLSDALKKLRNLHNEFSKALDSIDFPFDSERRIRRKNIFIRKYIHAQRRVKIMNELHIEKDVYNDDLNWACAQFAFSLNIHVFKE